MKHRKLRIAWSVAWGIAMVLLIALSVRSYWIADGLIYARRTTVVTVFTSAGGAGINYASFPSGTTIGNNPGLEWVSNPVQPDPELRAFAWRSRSEGPLIRVPAWCCESVLILLAALPWLRWRFSLRTLLIATTLVAVGLGLIVWL